MKISRTTEKGRKEPQPKSFVSEKKGLLLCVERPTLLSKASYTHQDSCLKCLLLQKDEVHPSFRMFPPPSPPPRRSVVSSEAPVDDLPGHRVDQASLQNPRQVHAKGSLKRTDSPDLRGAGTHWERGCGSGGPLRRAGEVYC